MPYNPEKGPEPKREQRPQEDKKAAAAKKLGEQAIKGTPPKGR